MILSSNDVFQENFVDCGCGCHKVLLQYDEEFDSFYLSMWTFEHMGGRLGLWDSIKIACRALFLRRLHEDQVILDGKEADRFAAWIINTKKECEKANV